MSSVVQLFHLSLEARYNPTTEGPCAPRPVTQIFLRSLQYGIVVMAIIDQHRRNADNPGNFGDCMQGRIRFMIAITPTCAHAYQTVTRNFAHLQPMPDIRIFPTLEPQRVKKAMISKDGPFTRMEEPALLMVRPLLAGA